MRSTRDRKIRQTCWIQTPLFKIGSKTRSLDVALLMTLSLTTMVACPIDGHPVWEGQGGRVHTTYTRIFWADTHIHLSKRRNAL